MANNKKGSSKSAKSKSEKKSDIRKIKKTRLNKPVLIASILLTLFLVGNLFFGEIFNPKGEQIKVSEINEIIQKGEYEQIVARDSYVAVESKKDGETVWQHALIKTEESYCDTLANRGVDAKNCEYKPTVAWADVILLISIVAGLGLFYMFIKNMSQSGNRLMEIGQSKARMLFGKKVKTNFNDVAGIDEVKEEIVEIVDFLKHPKKYIQAGARIPRGVLLVGAPGTGKTLLAKALAGEANVPFFHTSGSEFEEMLVGAGASRVRDLFKKAKRAAPCIVFIDEIDAIAKKRGTTVHTSHTDQTLNQILVEMDGLEERENVIVLAATNRPDILDPAILRPGRFDRTVVVQMPDYRGRKEIIDVHSKDKKFADDVDLDLIAKKTVSYSGADLENLLNEAAIMSAKDNRKKINQSDLMEAYLKVKLGRQKKHKRTEEDIKRVAYHESGHAVVAHFTEGSDPVEKISIVSRGYAGGVTIYVPEEDSDFNTKTQLLAKIQYAVGGKVAEEVFLGESSTGPASDVKQATKMARRMIQKYGMSEKLGFVRYGEDEDWTDVGYQYEGAREYSEETARDIDEEVKRLTDEAQVNARKILEDNKDKVEDLVKILLDKEVVDKDEFEDLMGDDGSADKE